MIRRARSFIVGSGFKLQSLTSDAALNTSLEIGFREWWRRPEITGLLSGAKCESMVGDELLTCGELGVVLTNEDRIQLVEAEQIRGVSTSEDGITRDRYGRPVSFRVCPYGADGSATSKGAVEYGPDTFLYIASLERPSSGRAVPPSQAAFPMLHRINDVCDSEAISWQIQSRIALSVTRTAGMPSPTDVAHLDDSESDDDAEGDPTSRWVTELPYATIFHGGTGEEIKGMERTAPSSTFSDTLNMFFRLLGLPLGLPLELTLLDWTRSNYSQSRAVLEQAKVSFLEWQSLLEDGFYRRVYEWWVGRQVAAGRVESRPDLLAHEWIKPSFPWIDQLAEAQAHGEKVDRGFSTFGGVCKTLNSDRETVVAQLERETVEAIKAAERVKAETGVDVPWQPFAGKKPPATAAQPGPGASTAPAPKPAAKPAGPAPVPSDGGSALAEFAADPAPAAPAQQPVNVTVNLPAGMVSAPVTIEKGAVQVDSPVNMSSGMVHVDSPVTIEAGAVSAPVTIEKGAVQVDSPVTIEKGAVEAPVTIDAGAVQVTTPVTVNVPPAAKSDQTVVHKIVRDPLGRPSEIRTNP